MTSKRQRSVHMPFPSSLFCAGLLTILCTGCASANETLAWPLPDAENRPMLLTFGLYVTPDPEQNPIDPPERFTGFHAGLDFEIFEGEAESNIPVFAICSGKVLVSGATEGYGGLVTTQCRIQGKTATVLYGHLGLEYLPKVGSSVKAGERIAVLAAARSVASDGNRKHLHLGIHKGKALEYRGYVENEKELEDFIDPLTVLPSRIPM